MRTLTIFAALLILTGSTRAQEAALKGVQMVRTSNGSKQTLSSATASNQTIVLPTAAATGTGQGLKVSAVSGSTMSLAWDTPASGLANTSSQLTADAEDATAWSTGPLISVTSGKKYRIIGLFQMKRGTTTGSTNDLVQIRLNTPDLTYAQFSISCFDCPAGTTGVPSFDEGPSSSGANPSIDGPVIDPNGSQSGVVYTYRIEGLILPGATGSTRLTFNKSGGGGENAVMLAGSYWALQEIE